MPIDNSRWPFFALGIAFLVTWALHFVAWFIIVFVYHANAIPDVRRYYLPVYGLLGGSGVWIFLLTILVDVAAGKRVADSPEPKWRQSIGSDTTSRGGETWA